MNQKKWMGIWAVFGMWAGAAQAQLDILRPYDGPTGMSCNVYNLATKIEWNHLGGDWVDSKGVEQGSSPFASQALKLGQTGKVLIDVTKVGNEIRLQFVGSPISIKSRENGAASAPTLIVTNANGTKTRIPASADAMMPFVVQGPDGKPKCSSVSATGTGLLLQQNGAVVSFPKTPVGFQKLELDLTLSKVYGNTTIQVFKMTRPIKPMAPLTKGFSSLYAQDKGICNDPRVLYCEDWDRAGGLAPSDWWKRTKGTVTLDSPSRWLVESNGVTFPSGWSEVSYEPQGGLNNTGGLKVHYAPDHLWGTAVPAIDFVKAGFGEQEHLFYRYYIKYDKDFFDSVPCDGGKRPGFAALNTYGGNGGNQVFGLNGWSMRGHYLMSCDHANPTYPRVTFGTYAYHGLQKGFYGDSWHWTGNGEQGLQALDKWVCVEGETKVNTPGVANGIDRHWLDGRLVFEKTDVYMRGVKPPQGYGNWRVPKDAAQEALWVSLKYPVFKDPVLKKNQYLVGGLSKILPGSKLGIQMFWGTAHHGGKHPFGKSVNQHYDQTIVAKERIGCQP